MDPSAESVFSGFAASVLESVAAPPSVAGVASEAGFVVAGLDDVFVGVVYFVVGVVSEDTVTVVAVVVVAAVLDFCPVPVSWFACSFPVVPLLGLSPAGPEGPAGPVSPTAAFNDAALL